MAHSAIPLKQILSIMLNEHPKALITHKDIYNEKKQFHYENLSPYTPTQALLAEFERCKV